MHKSPAMLMVGQVTWLVTALASINIGLKHVGMAFMLPMWAKYIIGLSGAVCLYLIIMTIMCQMKK